MHLLRDVEKFLRQNDTPPTRFGHCASRTQTLDLQPLLVLRALIGRARVARDRILLTDISSVDWQSLTFSGERHRIELRVPGPNSAEIVERMCDRLDDAEFSIPAILVADIGVAAGPRLSLDGSTSVTIEALTVADD